MSRPIEIWADIPSAPGWRASDWGRICLPPTSLKMPNGGVKLLSVDPTFGHLDLKKRRFKISVSGRTRWISALICEAFKGPRPSPRHECMHLDEDSLNNRPTNLDWGTKSQNQKAPKLNAARRVRLLKYHQDRRENV